MNDYCAVLARHGVAHTFNAWTRMPTLADQVALRSITPGAVVTTMADENHVQHSFSNAHGIVVDSAGQTAAFSGGRFISKDRALDPEHFEFRRLGARLRTRPVRREDA